MKKAIFVSLLILFILFIVFLALTNLPKYKISEENKKSVAPTPVSLSVNKLPSSQPSKKIATISAELTETQINRLNELKNNLPYETYDFKIEFSPSLDKFIITKKTSPADEALNKFAQDYQITDLINNENFFLKKDLSVNPSKHNLQPTISNGKTVNSSNQITPTKSINEIADERAEKKMQQAINIIKSILSIGSNIKLDQFNYPSVTPTTVTTNSPTPFNNPGNYDNLGLPNPVADGPNGYNTLKYKIESNGNAIWATKQLLEAEKYDQSKGINLIKYLTTAWVWFENGAASWPDPYQINCNDNRPGFTSEVNFFCSSTNFQIAGYQAAGRKNDYISVYNKLYNQSELRTIMQTVVDNSYHASQTKWKYNSQTVPTNISLNDISPSSNFFSEKSQFNTLILGKDAKMVVALNSFAVNQSFLNQLRNANDGNKLYGYIGTREVQLISNMIAALYLIDGGSFSSSSNNNSSVLAWAQTISDNLEPGTTCGNWYCRMVNNINNNGYSVAVRQGIDDGTTSTGRYWCTRLVIDSFSLNGRTNVTGASEAVINMTRFWENTSGYKYINYSGSNSTNYPTLLSQVSPGCAMFQETNHGNFTGYEHTAIVKEININNGNGYIVTLDANAPDKTNRYVVDDWNIVNNYYPYVSFGC